MRFRSLHKWDEPARNSGLLFFAQLLEEMLFEYSLDTYKASVMHTGTLCTEAVDVLREIEAGNIAEPNIWHVTAELCDSFERDPIAQALSPLPYGAFVAKFKEKKAPLRELGDILRLLRVQLSPGAYRHKTEELLIGAISDNEPFVNIRRLTRNYITTLLAIGFSQKFIYDTALEFFWKGDDRISSPAAISEFLSRIPKKRRRFTAIFHVDRVFRGATDALASLALKIVDDFPDEYDDEKWVGFKAQARGRSYVIVPDIEAPDFYSARIGAENDLKLGATFLSLFHHKKEPTWSTDSIVIEMESKTSRRISKTTNSMHKCVDLREPIAAQKFKLFTDEFSLERNSFSKFIRSAELHSMALSSDTSENQILNLWISLESLIPSDTKSSSVSNIEHIVSSIVPFLNGRYLERLLDNLVRDLLRWNYVATRSAIRNIPGKRFSDRLIKLFSLPDFSADLTTLEFEFRDFHLLRDRVNYFKDMLVTPQKFVRALDNHKQRIEWQIRRIYRARNIIVHTGITPNYTHILIEHTHDYLDCILETLVKLASKPKRINSVGQGFKYVELKYETYYRRLLKKDLQFNITNIEQLLFDR